MRTLLPCVLACGALACLVAGGCGDAPAKRGAPARPAETPAAQQSPAVPAAAAPAEAATLAGYNPPFPEREDLFAPPNPELAAKAARSTAATDVVLKGIVQFEGARALLEIDGQVVQLRERGHHGSVHVVSIDPPRVTLKRGERTWTASLREGR